MSIITPIILAGGTGERLWPLSRKTFPKQFSDIFGEYSLFQMTVDRVSQKNAPNFNKQIILTSEDYRFIVKQQLRLINTDKVDIIIEPQRKNTGPAVLSASLHMLERDPEAILLVMPSDHIIGNNKVFYDCINKGLSELRKGNIVCVGVTPKYPETGYGYIRVDGNPKDGSVKASKFVEKPTYAVCEQMVKSGNYLWNSGIFLFRAKDMVDAFRRLSPDIFSLIEKSVKNMYPDLGFLRLGKGFWDKIDDISVDYAIMERIKNLSCVKYHADWSDLGHWKAVWDQSYNLDAHNNLTDRTSMIDCDNVFLRSESKDQHLVGIGLKDIIAVAMADAVLILNKDRAQDVKLAVKKLKEKKIAQAEKHPTDHRPWGKFDILNVAEGYQVKKIEVFPNSALSLQKHHHRSEHWVIVEGEAKITVDEKTFFAEKGESVYIPKETIHRLENVSEKNLIIVEVQTGDYLGEDDIIRLDDMYRRQ